MTRNIGAVIGVWLQRLICHYAAVRHWLGRWHIGRRGAFLIMFGVIYVALGWSYTGNRPTHDLRRALRVATEIMPLWLYGIGWMATGLAGILFGIFRPRNTYGFAVLSIAPLGWAGWYFVGWQNHDTSRGPVSCAVYTAFAVSVMIVSGMVDPLEVDPVAKAKRTRRRWNPCRRWW